MAAPYTATDTALGAESDSFMTDSYNKVLYEASGGRSAILASNISQPSAASGSGLRNRQGRKATFFGHSPLASQPMFGPSPTITAAPTAKSPAAPSEPVVMPVFAAPGARKAPPPNFVSPREHMNQLFSRSRARSRSQGSLNAPTSILPNLKAGFILPPDVAANPPLNLSSKSPPPLIISPAENEESAELSSQILSNIPFPNQLEHSQEEADADADAEAVEEQVQQHQQPISIVQAAAGFPREATGLIASASEPVLSPRAAGPSVSAAPISAVARIHQLTSMQNSRRRSNAAPTISLAKKPAHQSMWSKIDWRTVPATPQSITMIRESAEAEMNQLKEELASYKSAFEVLFEQQNGRKPSEMDVQRYRPRVARSSPFGEWLVTLDREKVKVMQRTIRKYNMRTKFRELSREYMRSQGAAGARNRNDIVREIMTTEKAYVGSLKILIEDFEITLLKAVADGRLHGSKQCDSPAAIKRLLARVFGNVEEIYQSQQEILSQLCAEFNKWPGPLSVSQIFTGMIPKLRAYSVYVNNYDSAIEALSILSRHSNFKEIHSEIQRRPHCKLGLEMLLIMPVQRIPRYELLLKQLQKMTPPEHRDYTTLPQVIKLIEDTATRINEEKRKSEAKELLYSLQRKVRDCPDLLVEGRALVHKGKLNVNGSRLSAVFKNKRSVYLFTDMIMITSQTLSGVICEDSALLKDTQVVNMIDDNQFVLLLLTTDGRPRRRYHFITDSNEQKAYWLQHLTKFTSQNRRNTQEFIEQFSGKTSPPSSPSMSHITPGVSFSGVVASNLTSSRSNSSPAPRAAEIQSGQRPHVGTTASSSTVTFQDQRSSPISPASRSQSASGGDSAARQVVISRPAALTAGGSAKQAAGHPKFGSVSHGTPQRKNSGGPANRSVNAPPGRAPSVVTGAAKKSGPPPVVPKRPM